MSSQFDLSLESSVFGVLIEGEEYERGDDVVIRCEGDEFIVVQVGNAETGQTETGDEQTLSSETDPLLGESGPAGNQQQLTEGVPRDHGDGETATCSSRSPLSDSSTAAEPQLTEPVPGLSGDTRAGASLRELISPQANPSTKKKTDSCIYKFRTWLASKHGMTCDIKYIEPEKLDTFIGEWIMSLKKPDDSDYEPDSLTSFHRSLSRYLRSVGYPCCIIRDVRFSTSRDVLAAKRKQLKSQGLGNKPNRAAPIYDQTIDLLWEREIMGMHNANALLNFIWFQNTQLLGLRGSHKSRQMCWGDMQIEQIMKEDGSMEEVLRWRERLTKTRQDATDTRQFVPTIYPNLDDPSKCMLTAFKLYRSQRPESMLSPDSPFYIAINHSLLPKTFTIENPQPVIECKKWFKCQPLGQHTIREMMKRMCVDGEVTQKYTNHSIRKRAITKLVHSGIEANKIGQYSGHHNEASINSYAVVSTVQQREMSHILQKIPRTHKTEPKQALTFNRDLDPQHAALALPAPQPNVNNPSRSLNMSNRTQSSMSMGANMSGLFAGASIHGGTFTITIQGGQSSQVAGAPLLPAASAD